MATPPPQFRLEASDLAGLKQPETLARLLSAFTGPVRDALNHGLTFADNFAGEVRTLDVKVPDEWHPLALVNGFTRHPSTAFLPPAWRVVGGNTVELRGLVTRSAGAPPFGTVIASGLPKATGQQRNTVDGNGAHALVETLASGALSYAAGDVSLLSLSGVRYETTEDDAGEWDAPVAFSLRDDFQGKASAVLVLRADYNGKQAPCGPPAWDAVQVKTSDGKVRAGVSLRRLPGLLGGRKYSVTFLVLGGV